jgi:hypothetical protein
VESSCERGFHKMLGTTELLHKLWPLEWYSVPQSLLVSLNDFRTSQKDTYGPPRPVNWDSCFYV